jgi:hypothetical protein
MTERRVLVCWVPGMDRRRLNAQDTPFVASLLRTAPSIRLQTFPGPEYLSTAVTGVWPNTHGIWHVQLREPLPRATRWQHLADGVPDLLAVAAQCLARELAGAVPLPTLPPVRRRRLTVRHLKFYRRASLGDLLAKFDGTPSIFSVLGVSRCTYQFSDSVEHRGGLQEVAGDGRVTLEFVHSHALDAQQHWQLETPEEVRAAYRATDTWLAAVHRRAAAHGVTLVLAVPHGQEPVVGTIDVHAALQAEGLTPADATWMLEPGRARFWCHTERGRTAVTRLLQQVPHSTALSWRDWGRFGFEFTDARGGEVYLFPDPGYLIFPHDFYHPLVNAVQGWRKAHMRRRLRDPRHVGLHGYLPEHPSSEGFLCVADAGCEALVDRMPLVDVAPTLLGVLGAPVPPFMQGASRMRLR